MPIVQFFITLCIGVVFLGTFIFASTKVIMFVINEDYDIIPRVILGGVIGLLSSYLLGLLVVNALGGYYGLSELLK